MYVIVDIETTGAYAAANGITEISIQVFDGVKVVERFDSLINPIHHIPSYIQSMTGITNEMVADAPMFDEVAERIFNILDGKVFVAHNVNFDYSFLKSQLFFAGYELNSKKLCTIRLARKIIPGYPSYSLGNICDQLKIEHKNKHRAGGDTDATVLLFQYLLSKDAYGFIDASLKKMSKEQMLPPNVPKEDFDKLPTQPGVYYFHDVKGKVIYVGKAKNIKSRVNSHFSNNSVGQKKQNFLRYIHHISYEICATEMMAAIQESIEIKKLWPKYNASQKKHEDNYGLVDFMDQNGYLRLVIEKMNKSSRPFYTFHHIDNGKSFLRKLVADFKLCEKMCFVDNPLLNKVPHELICEGSCTKKELPEQYNRKVENALLTVKQQPSFAIIDKGIVEDEKSVILVENGRFYGMGYLPMDYKMRDLDMIKSSIRPMPENSYISHLLFDFAKKFPKKILHFSNTLIPHF